MKKIALLLLVLAFIICGCRKSEEPPAVVDTPGNTDSPFHKTVPVGEVPEEFEIIVAHNLFCGVTAYGDRLLQVGNPYIQNVIKVYDTRGEEIMEKILSLKDHEKIAYCAITEDGGLLYIYGTNIHYGTASYDVKDIVSYINVYNADGRLITTKEMRGCEADMFEAVVVAGSEVYYFGTVTEEKNGKKSVGEGQTDISVIKAMNYYQLIGQKTYGGSDYESFRGVTYNDSRKSFDIAVMTQSTDGIFEGKITEKQLRPAIITVESFLGKGYVTLVDRLDTGRRVGILDWREIYDDDEMFEGFADGEITALIDYGDFYLIVSENKTGIMETPAAISSIHYTTETVYAAYGKDGTLIWKMATDSTGA